METKYTKQYFTTKFCPLCKSKKNVKYGKCYKNLYSEIFSKILNINEDTLLNNFKNVKCINCGLVYKKKWFTTSVLKKVYNKFVPNHPKGWDALAERFTKKNLTKQIELFIKKPKNNKELRSLYSIVDSIIVKNIEEKKLKKIFLNAIIKKKISYIQKFKENTVTMLNEPEEYKRFSGFKSKDLFSFLEMKIPGLDSYSEIGCPLWGMHRIAKKRGLLTVHFKGNNNLYWGGNCKNKNLSCYKKCLNLKIVDRLKNKINQKISYVGIYAYLDHIINLNKFLDSIFKYSKSCGMIIEDLNHSIRLGMPIQHYTGWDTKPMKFLAKKFNKKLSSRFKKINSSGNKFYLIH